MYSRLSSLTSLPAPAVACSHNRMRSSVLLGPAQRTTTHGNCVKILLHDTTTTNRLEETKQALCHSSKIIAP
ncbi:hypothetical protein HaLaN_01539, partial [Haematococcus lacustris]